MAIVHECNEPECHVLTMGELCLEHELTASRTAAGPGNDDLVTDVLLRARRREERHRGTDEPSALVSPRPVP